MTDLENHAEIKATLHTIMMEIAQIKSAINPEVPAEEHIKTMMVNTEAMKNRIINATIKGEKW